MTRGQRKLIHFAVKYPDKWHAFAHDYQTVGIVCACVRRRYNIMQSLYMFVYFPSLPSLCFFRSSRA